jgi:hypothetical protein
MPKPFGLQLPKRRASITGGWQGGRRSREPFRAVRPNEGSNPSPQLRRVEPVATRLASRGFGPCLLRQGEVELVHRLPAVPTDDSAEHDLVRVRSVDADDPQSIRLVEDLGAVG